MSPTADPAAHPDVAPPIAPAARPRASHQAASQCRPAGPAHTGATADRSPASPASDAAPAARRATAPHSPDTRACPHGQRHYAAAPATPSTGNAQSDARSPAPHTPERATPRSPPAPQTTDTGPTTQPATPSASRHPPETTGRQPPARPPPQPPPARSPHPARSPPRTAAAAPANPPPAARQANTSPADPSPPTPIPSNRPSQPLPIKRCDDQLNPPYGRRSPTAPGGAVDPANPVANTRLPQLHATASRRGSRAGPVRPASWQTIAPPVGTRPLPRGGVHLETSNAVELEHRQARARARGSSYSRNSSVIRLASISVGRRVRVRQRALPVLLRSPGRCGAQRGSRPPTAVLAPWAPGPLRRAGFVASKAGTGGRWRGSPRRCNELRPRRCRTALRTAARKGRRGRGAPRGCRAQRWCRSRRRR